MPLIELPGIRDLTTTFGIEMATYAAEIEREGAALLADFARGRMSDAPISANHSAQ